MKAHQEGNQAYYHAGQFQLAVQHYSVAIQEDPNNYKLYTNRSMAYLKLGQPHQALLDTLACLQKCPTFPKGFLCKGHALLLSGEYEAAVEAFNKAGQLSASDPHAPETVKQEYMLLASGGKYKALVAGFKHHHSGIPTGPWGGSSEGFQFHYPNHVIGTVDSTFFKDQCFYLIHTGCILGLDLYKPGNVRLVSCLPAPWMDFLVRALLADPKKPAQVGVHKIEWGEQKGCFQMKGILLGPINIDITSQSPTKDLLATMNLSKAYSLPNHIHCTLAEFTPPPKQNALSHDFAQQVLSVTVDGRALHIQEIEN